MTKLTFTETKITPIEIVGENFNRYEIEGTLIEEDYDDGREVLGVLRKNGKEVSKFGAAMNESVSLYSVRPKWSKADKSEFIRAAAKVMHETEGKAATFLYWLLDGINEFGAYAL